MTKESLALISLAGFVGLLASSNADAQSLKNTPVPGVWAFNEPPGNFVPLTASYQLLVTYGLPPAPSPTAGPAAYAAWYRAMASITQFHAGNVSSNFQFHEPFGAASRHGVSMPNLSSAWSGTAVTGPAGSFQAEAIQATFGTPSIKPGSGSCVPAGAPQPPGGPAISSGSQWVGIDGVGSPDVLQAGIGYSIQCNQQSQAAQYQAWIEWYPGATLQVDSPKISSGDLVQVSIWATSPKIGCASIIDVTSGVSASYMMSAPVGVTLAGNSVEWITENPLNGTSVGNLASYVTSTWFGAAAWNYTATAPTYYYAGNPQVPAAASYETFSIVNSNSTVISSPIVGSADILVFQSY